MDLRQAVDVVQVDVVVMLNKFRFPGGSQVSLRLDSEARLQCWVDNATRSSKWRSHRQRPSCE